MEDQTTPISARIKLSTLTDIQKELQWDKKNRSDWISEAIEEKLTNDNKEILEREIKFREEELKLLKRKRANFKEKEEIIKEIPSGEISFFLETKKVVEQDPNFIQGRISLYKNKFNKNHLRISIPEFMDMIENAYNQYKESLIMKDELKIKTGKKQ